MGISHRDDRQLPAASGQEGDRVWDQAQQLINALQSHEMKHLLTHVYCSEMTAFMKFKHAQLPNYYAKFSGEAFQ